MSIMRCLDCLVIFFIAVLLDSGCGSDSPSITEPDKRPSSIITSPRTTISESFAWLLNNHSDKIAHSDAQRNIVQIKVLDQTILGSRQCGFHGVRNFFFLAALSEAISNRNSDLLNKLYRELHDETMFRRFVDELATIIGCPTTHFHQSFPDESQLKTLYKNATTSFPSSLSIKDIIDYGVVKDGTVELAYYKNPPSDEEIYYDEFLKEVKQDFNFELTLSDHLKDLMKINFPSPSALHLFALKNLLVYKPFSIFINMQGEPGHAVSAAIFRPRDEKKPTFLFADSWNNVSFLSGWSEATIDVLYKLFASIDDAKNLSLLRECLLRFTRETLFYESEDQLVGQLTTLLAQAKADPVKKKDILDRLTKFRAEFDSLVQHFDLQSASLYAGIKKLIEKIRTTYENGLQ